ncbi:MAG: hypothetical protein NC311_01885 [Muribaculaceae bacterium]|nr:hypothetical protein [Muribaculaceae bacterium]
MKKLLIMIPTLMAVQMSHAGTQLFLGNSGSNLNSVIPGARGGYYKCTNSVAFSCQSDYISIEYGSMSGGSGTAVSPYILTNCSFITCACGYKYYLIGKTCVACDFDAMVAPDVSVIHANSSASACTYCPSDMLKTEYRPAPRRRINKMYNVPIKWYMRWQLDTPLQRRILWQYQLHPVPAMVRCLYNGRQNNNGTWYL